MRRLIQCCPHCRREVSRLQARPPGMADVDSNDILSSLRAQNLDFDESLTSDQKDGLKAIQIDIRQALLNYETLVELKPEQTESYKAGLADTEARLRDRAIRILGK